MEYITAFLILKTYKHTQSPKRKRFLIVYYEELLLQNSLNFANYDPKIKILKKLSNGRLIQRIFVLRHK